MNASQKTNLARAIQEGKLSSIKVAETLNLDRKTPNNWVKKLKHLEEQGVELPIIERSSLGGRPRTVHPDAAQKFLENVEECTKANKSIAKVQGDLNIEAIRLAQSSQMLRGHPPTITKLDPRTVKSALSTAGVKTVKGRQISKARVEAVADPRNAITYSRGVESTCRGRRRELIGNFDSTQFCGKGSDVLVLRSVNTPTEVESRYIYEGPGMAVFVKYVSTFFANGFGLSPLFIVANENIPDDQFIIEKVPLLSHSTNPADFGYIAFSKTRAGNSELWVWFFLNIIIPGITAIQNACGLDVESSTYRDDISCAFFFDGEQLQNEAVEDQRVVDAAELALTFLLKLCASCSLIQQLCDLMRLYNACKHDLKIMRPSDFSNPTLEKHISEAIIKNNTVLSMSAAQRSQLTETLLKIASTIKTHVTVTNVISGAKRAGLIADSDEEWETITRMIPFKKCTYNFTNAEMRHIFSQWENLGSLFDELGHFPDRRLDELGIPRGDFDENCDVFKEDLVEYRWRFTWKNHEGLGTARLARKLAIAAAAEELARKKIAAEALKAAQIITEPISREISIVFKEIEGSKSTALKKFEFSKRLHIAAKKMNKQCHIEINNLAELRQISDAKTKEVKCLYSLARTFRDNGLKCAKDGNLVATEINLEELAEIKRNMLCFEDDSRQNEIESRSRAPICLLQTLEGNVDIANQELNAIEDARDEDDC